MGKAKARQDDGAKIRAMRKRLGLSQAALGKLAGGYDRTTVLNAEKDVRRALHGTVMDLQEALATHAREQAQGQQQGAAA